MKYKNILFTKFIMVILTILLPGCMVFDVVFNKSINPMGAGAPEINEKGKFSDTPYNRAFFEKRARDSIYREKNNLLPGHDWKRAWRISFEEFDKSSVNPQYKKKFIIKLRKELGLPIWPFMLE